MRSIINSFLIPLLSFWMLCLVPSNLRAQYDSIPFGGYDRTYLLHLPTGYTGTEKLPLVVAMHGGFGNAYNIEQQSQLSIKSDSEHFIVVYPEGVKSPLLNISSWNAGLCCGFAQNNNIDDVGFIDSLLNTLIENFEIDTNRIYATGMSNGGFMSYRLASELSERIAAIAPVAATMNLANCTPERSVPIIHFNSALDANVPLEGGVGSGSSNHYNSPIDSVLNVWSALNSCSVTNDTIISNLDYTFTKWSSCECNRDIHYYKTEDGGHSWPGGTQTILGDPVSTVINATDLMWTFFQEHSLDCDDLSVMNQTPNSSKIELFPNPTNHMLTVKMGQVYSTLEISIYSSIGEHILTVTNQTYLNFNSLPQGTYFLQIQVDGHSTRHKIIKSK